MTPLLGRCTRRSFLGAGATGATMVAACSPGSAPAPGTTDGAAKRGQIVLID